MLVLCEMRACFAASFVLYLRALFYLQSEGVQLQNAAGKACKARRLHTIFKMLDGRRGWGARVGPARARVRLIGNKARL